MNRYLIDGRNIFDIDSLTRVFGRAASPEAPYFGHNLQSFHDCLFGGFGIESPAEIVWEHHEYSKRQMGADFDQVVELIRSVEPRSSGGTQLKLTLA